MFSLRMTFSKYQLYERNSKLSYSDTVNNWVYKRVSYNWKGGCILKNVAWIIWLYYVDIIKYLDEYERWVIQQ